MFGNLGMWSKLLKCLQLLEILVDIIGCYFAWLKFIVGVDFFAMVELHGEFLSIYFQGMWMVSL